MTSRLAPAFARLKREKRAALVAFVTAGDPDVESTERLVPALVAAGADVIELGVPYSDPTADGPAIQRSSARALAAGTRVSDVLALVSRLRRAGIEAPIVLFGYVSPVLAFGPGRFAQEAAAAGADGVLLVDCPPEELRTELWDPIREAGLDAVHLLAPTSGPDRIDAICKRASGFIYVVSMTGVTGAQLHALDDAARVVAEIRARTAVPACVGFGVHTPQDATRVAAVADGVVVGTALVRTGEERRAAGDENWIEAVAERVRALAGAVREGR